MRWFYAILPYLPFIMLLAAALVAGYHIEVYW